MRTVAPALLILLFPACASTKPYHVPEFKDGSLPVLLLEGLKPRTLELKVVVQRKVNQAAGNAAEAARAVESAVIHSLNRTGIQVGDRSVNQLAITALDCDETPQGSECVKIQGKFVTPRWTLDLESESTHGHQRGDSVHRAFGEVSEAYIGALTQVIERLEDRCAAQHGY